MWDADVNRIANLWLKRIFENLASIGQLHISFFVIGGNLRKKYLLFFANPILAFVVWNITFREGLWFRPSSWSLFHIPTKAALSISALSLVNQICILILHPVIWSSFPELEWVTGYERIHLSRIFRVDNVNRFSNICIFLTSSMCMVSSAKLDWRYSNLTIKLWLFLPSIFWNSEKVW